MDVLQKVLMILKKKGCNDPEWTDTSINYNSGSNKKK